MFISVFDIFKIGVGPSSSHTMGPMIAAENYIALVNSLLKQNPDFKVARIKCTLKGSLAFTGKGHATDSAVLLGVHGYKPENLIEVDIPILLGQLNSPTLISHLTTELMFDPEHDIKFDFGDALFQHPNGMIMECLDENGERIHHEIYFSIGGGFITTVDEINSIEAPIKGEPAKLFPYPFNNAELMLELANQNQVSIAEMKLTNEKEHLSDVQINKQINKIWQAMKSCVENGLEAEGILPGGLKVKRRAKNLYTQLKNEPATGNVNDWLCAYAMAVNEENAAGHMVVTAPTNGAAGVVPAVLYYFMEHENGTLEDVKTFLLTAAAIGGLIKHNSSISGAEVGCQGEVGSASAMAAAGLCAVKGGIPEQIEQAAEMALEHHLGMTCDPVKGLVQVPCIERNGFGAIKAYTSSSIALRESGEHIMPLDSCIAAMKKTGDEMSHKYKETSLGGLAVTWVEC
ncbi:L-serine ammonia-lyase [Thiomicrorhabdus sp. Kp2]|uniref:L-serine ammonia-lyase n=1 Tax=Thiomicrorhabdus sp. Kp2 TaxID=1123518 RepID=UPI0003FAFFA0|nr:L-serine ammonia-lyase [Thiomicrorhabdus sp. Kp2]